ncbi:MAG TPA: FKBP-type peptidyl-prolyl cis-trans isomerase [Puia sp.]|nr:FKBP-type peptidyl-prolyl cis-trans isomerase [Puia sp.]
MIVLTALAGCTHLEWAGGAWSKGEGDLLYNMVEDKGGETIKEGEVVELSVTARTEEDSLVWSSADYDRPALVKRERSLFKGDLFSALGLLSEGDSAVVRINIDSMEFKMGVPRPGTTKGRYLIYTMRIGHVVHRGKLPDSLYAAKVDTFLEARLDRLKLEEPMKVDAFVTRQHWTTTVTSSGLRYSWIQKGTGPAPMQGDTMEIKYTGRLMSGKVIASTEVARIPYSIYGTIPGFSEMSTSMPKGSKVKALIPSALAYGREGRDGSIQAYTPLVYEMEMVDIIHPAGVR